VPVSIGGEKAISDGDGMVEAEVTGGASCVPVTLPGGAQAMKVGALDFSSDDDVCKTRLFNMGFLWDVGVDWDDEEAVVALEDFQAQYQLEMTGQLDEVTKAKLAEVYGC
jgi:hypothetical protein